MSRRLVVAFLAVNLVALAGTAIVNRWSRRQLHVTEAHLAETKAAFVSAQEACREAAVVCGAGR